MLLTGIRPFFTKKEQYLNPMSSSKQPGLRAPVQRLEPGSCGSSKQLISLGLTEREAEVLTWIAKGKGNYEIGVILGAQTRTICKHSNTFLASSTSRTGRQLLQLPLRCAANSSICFSSAERLDQCL